MEDPTVYCFPLSCFASLDYEEEAERLASAKKFLTSSAGLNRRLPHMEDKPTPLELYLVSRTRISS
jgi:hypothetical protein